MADDDRVIVTAHAADAADAADARRERRRRAPAIALGVVGLLAAGFVAGDIAARAAVEDRTRASVRDLLDLADDAPVAVSVDGWSVLPQVVAGRLAGIDVSVDDATVGDLTADIDARLEGVPVDGSGPLDDARVSLDVPEASIAGLSGALSGRNVDRIRLDAPDIRFDSSVEVLGLPFTVGVAVRPGVDDGDLTFRPTALSIGGTEYTASSLIGAFGDTARDLLQTRSVCIASELPRGVTVGEVDVVDHTLSVGLVVSRSVLSDVTQQEPGVCSG